MGLTEIIVTFRKSEKNELLLWRDLDRKRKGTQERRRGRVVAVRAQEVSRFLPSLPDGRQLPEGLKVMAPKLSPKAPGLLPHGHRIKAVAAGERGETKRVS